MHAMHGQILTWPGQPCLNRWINNRSPKHTFIACVRSANNEFEGKIGKTGQLSTKFIRIQSDGSCFFNPTAVLVSHCSVEVDRFPFDEQRCWIEYELWGHDSGHVQLNALEDAVDLLHYQQNGEWDLLGEFYLRPVVIDERAWKDRVPGFKSVFLWNSEIDLLRCRQYWIRTWLYCTEYSSCLVVLNYFQLYRRRCFNYFHWITSHYGICDCDKRHVRW